MALPEQYRWITREGGPLMVNNAVQMYGTAETLGARNNPIILSWAKEVDPNNRNIGRDYTADSIPWCGLFIAVVAKRSNKEIVNQPLWALNWRNFGKVVTQPMLGDVLVFLRDGGGHVGIYVGEDSECYHVLGGNQSNTVCITRIRKNRLKAARRPNYINQPTNVRRILLSASGSISNNES